MALARARPDEHPMGMSNTQPLVAPRGDLSNKQSSDSDTRDRLRLTGSRAPSEHIDGAWWPASRRLADELPDLLAAVHDRLGQVALVGYRRDDWTATPSLVDIGGERSVELLGLISDDPPSVILIGQDGHHLTLRVIDPETNEELAGQALEEIPRRAVAARPGASQTARSVVDVARKLALHDGRNDAGRDAEILRWCEDASVQFDDARIQTFVPILVEHIVNGRIHRERHAGSAASSGNPIQPEPH